MWARRSQTSRTSVARGHIHIVTSAEAKWTVQAGCVIAFAGGGLMYSSSRFAANATFSEVGLPLFVMGATAVAIGAGFMISAIVAYGLSRRLGLLTSTQAGSAPDPGTAASHLS